MLKILETFSLNGSFVLTFQNKMCGAGIILHYKNIDPTKNGTFKISTSNLILDKKARN